MSVRPLVSFCVATYNQERFVADAVESALAQTYTPLEILFSDDCSSDRTFEFIQKRVEGYSGPHSIVLNRNPRNLGIGAHWNRVAARAKGDIIVHAAGDDVSHPRRTEELVRVLMEASPPVFACFSAYSDFTGDPIPFPEEQDRSPDIATYRFREMLRRGGGLSAGAVYAYRREVFDRFGPLPEDKVFYTEDRLLPLRAALLGGVATYPGTLLLRRVHDDNVSKPGGGDPGDYARVIHRLLQSQELGLRTVADDLSRAVDGGLISRTEYERAVAVVSRFESVRRARLACQDPVLVRRLWGCIRLILLAPLLPTPPPGRLRLVAHAVFRALNGKGIVMPETDTKRPVGGPYPGGNRATR